MLDREAAIAWYRRNRERTRELFDLLARNGAGEGDVYYGRPIALRHPIVFYEGHLPAFSFNTLVKKGLGGPSVDPRLEAIFARGIDPHEGQNPAKAASQETGSHAQKASANSAGSAVNPDGWPSREEVHAFAAEADRRVVDALCRADLDRPGHPLLDRAEAVFTILEHEAMHHETLLYMWHRLPLEDKRGPGGGANVRNGAELHRRADPPPDGGPELHRKADLRRSALPPQQEWIEIPGGTVTLGVDRRDVRFGWDNEFPHHTADVHAFSMERYNVTNTQFLEFVEAGGYADQRWWRAEDWAWIQREQLSHPLFWEGGPVEWYWRGMFERFPLPLAWPVYVSHAEASAYARWRNSRLPTEAEFQRAAFGSSEGEREYPWGSTEPSPDNGAFDFSSWDPDPVGSHPAGRSWWGVEDLVGNGWEWTSTVFEPFPGFRTMASYPEYSADFFDGEHMVMKGASPVTAAELLRPTFRNWFRARYPYVYATFRCVR